MFIPALLNSRAGAGAAASVLATNISKVGRLSEEVGGGGRLKR